MLNKLLFFIERASAYLQGKGWGTSSVEKEFEAALKLLSIHKPSICIDIGGNKGTYTQQIIKKHPSCKVIVFEPSQSNAKYLNELFKNNSNVKIENVAISSEEGNATLYSDEDGSGLASLTKRRLEHFQINFNNTEIVTTLRFEEYWKSELNCQHIDICKIDIEGHELDALAGFGDAIDHISIIQFEFGGCNIDTRTFFQDFWYFFKQHGFELFRVSPLGLVEVLEYREFDEVFSTTNYLARRKQ